MKFKIILAKHLSSRHIDAFRYMMNGLESLKVLEDARDYMIVEAKEERMASIIKDMPSAFQAVKEVMRL